MAATGMRRPHPALCRLSRLAPSDSRIPLTRGVIGIILRAAAVLPCVTRNVPCRPLDHDRFRERRTPKIQDRNALAPEDDVRTMARIPLADDRESLRMVVGLSSEGSRDGRFAER
jgi:hypothetical protein